MIEYDFSAADAKLYEHHRDSQPFFSFIGACRFLAKHGKPAQRRAARWALAELQRQFESSLEKLPK